VNIAILYWYKFPKGEGSAIQHSIWKLGGLTSIELAKRVWANIGAEHLNILGRSAELAFYFFLALFPGMLFVLTLVGLMAGGDPALRSTR
jgi:uncharacterized BrkB/YihY/UPF0761 family membrane protein